MPLWAQWFNRELRVPLGKRLTGCATRPLPQQKGATFAIVVLHFVWGLQLVSKPCYTNIGSGARDRALAAWDFGLSPTSWTSTWNWPYILDLDLELLYLHPGHLGRFRPRLLSGLPQHSCLDLLAGQDRRCELCRRRRFRAMEVLPAVRDRR